MRDARAMQPSAEDIDDLIFAGEESYISTR